MTDQSSIFGTNTQATPATPAGSNPASTTQTDQVGTFLSQIKNERGEPKYKTLEDALNALKHSQEYIPQLSQKLQEREQELETARQAAAKIAELENVVKSLTSPSSTTATQQPSVTAEQVAELVRSQLTAEQRAAAEKNNTAAVANAVAARFGDKAEQAFYSKATELGMSAVEFNSLAARNPKAVLSLLGITDTAVLPQQSKQSTQGTAINTASLQPQTETFVGRNKQPVLIGATTQQVREESLRSRTMVDELHAKGMTVHDLTDPKVYFKHFQ